MEIAFAVIVVGAIGLIASFAGGVGTGLAFLVAFIVGAAILAWALTAMARRQEHWTLRVSSQAVENAILASFSTVGWKRVDGPGMLNFQARGFGLGSQGAKRPVISLDVVDREDETTAVGIWTSSAESKAGIMALCDRVVSKKFWLQRELTELSSTAGVVARPPLGGAPAVDDFQFPSQRGNLPQGEWEALHDEPPPATDPGVLQRNDVTPPSWSQSTDPPADLAVGGLARIVVADKRFEGRIGEVVALTAHDVDLKIKGTFGALTFRCKDVIALAGPAITTNDAGVTAPGGLVLGATAKVISGNARFIGRVGRVEAVDGGTVSLRLRGALGALDFRIKDVQTVD